MPDLLDTWSRSEALLHEAEWLLLERGPRALTLRALARGAHISLGTLCDHYGTRSRLIHLLCQMAARRRYDDLARAVRDRGIDGLLPADQAELDRARVFASWTEIARASPDLRGDVVDLRLDERHLVRQCLHIDDDDVLDSVLALVEGLRHQALARVAPLSLARARDLLRRSVARLPEAA